MISAMLVLLLRKESAEKTAYLGTEGYHDIFKNGRFIEYKRFGNCDSNKHNF